MPRVEVPAGECAEGSAGRAAGGSGDASASSAASAASSAASFAAAASSRNASVSAEHETLPNRRPFRRFTRTVLRRGVLRRGRILRRRRARIWRDARLAHATQTRGDEPPATPPRRVRRYPRVRGIARIGRIARPRRGRDDPSAPKIREGWLVRGFGGSGGSGVPPRHPAAKRSLAASAGSNIVGKHPRRRERQRRGRRAAAAAGSQTLKRRSVASSLDAPFRRRSFGSISASGSTDAAVMCSAIRPAWRSRLSSAARCTKRFHGHRRRRWHHHARRRRRRRRDNHDISAASVLRFCANLTTRARRTPPRRPRSSSDSAPVFSVTAGWLTPRSLSVGIQRRPDSGTNVPTGTPPPRETVARGAPLKFPNLPKIKAGQ